MGNYTTTQTLKVTAPATERLRPLLKWAGGKTQELKYILPNLPDYYEGFYEPFVGGGAVYTAIQADTYFINDKSKELIELYSVIGSRKRATFFTLLNKLHDNWQKVAWIFIENELLLKKMYVEMFKLVNYICCQSRTIVNTCPFYSHEIK